MQKINSLYNFSLFIYFVILRDVIGLLTYPVSSVGRAQDFYSGLLTEPCVICVKQNFREWLHKV